MKKNDDALQHFLALARKGAYPGCSGGEVYARMFAEMIVDDMGWLDDQALLGFSEFVLLARKSLAKAKKLIK